MFGKYVLMCIAAALAFSGAASAQEAEAELMTEEATDVVWVGGTRLQKITVDGFRNTYKKDTTSSLTLLESDALAVRSAPNVADQLRAVPGVAVSRSGAAGGLTQVRIRGAEANHTLVLINGIEVSDPTTGETDFGLMSGLGATKIQVLRGEQSVFYGSDAIGGLIEITTGSTDWDDRLTVGQLEVGSRDSLRGSLGTEGHLNSTLITAAISGSSTSGVDTAGLGGEKDGSHSALAMLTAEDSEIFGWGLNGLVIYRQDQVDTDPDLNFDGRLDNADRETDSRLWITGLQANGNTQNIDHDLSASYTDSKRINRADQQRTDATSGQRVKLAWSPSIGWGGYPEHHEATQTHGLSGLLDYEIENYERTGQASFFGDPNQSQIFETMGAALEYRYSRQKFDLLAAVRHDLNDDRFDDTTTWRFGGAYQFDFGGRIRASIGIGVKNPTFTELFGFFPGSFVGNPALAPEKSQSWEIGWDQSFGALDASITYFTAELEDEIFTAFNPDFTSTARNRTGKSERSGVELGANWQVSNSVTLHGAATFIESSNDSGEDEIRVPGTSASISFDWQPNYKDGVRLGAAFDYVGEQEDFDFGKFPATRVSLEPYVLASLTAEYPLSDRVSVTLRGENLFDEKAMDVLGFHTPGAAAFVGLKLR